MTHENHATQVLRRAFHVRIGYISDCRRIAKGNRSLCFLHALGEELWLVFCHDLAVSIDAISDFFLPMRCEKSAA